MMDGNGDDLLWVGDVFSGPPVWSPNGEMIAIGCDHTLSFEEQMNINNLSRMLKGSVLTTRSQYLITR